MVKSMSNTCNNTCSTTCVKTCANECFNTCGGGCSSECTETCTIGCQGTCHTSCGATSTSTGNQASCNDSCVGSCSHSSYSEEDVTRREKSSCSSACVAQCSTSCGTSCGGTCIGTCSGLCLGTCISACTNDCMVNCISSCSMACSIECTDACVSNCRATCNRGCEGSAKSSGVCGTTCTGYCSASCNTLCEQSCVEVCFGTCANTCKGSCFGDCANACSADCANNCVTGCSSACKLSCFGTATKSTYYDSLRCTACTTSCIAACVNTCMYSCDSDCTNLCVEGCTGTCAGDCEGTGMAKQFIMESRFDRAGARRTLSIQTDTGGYLLYPGLRGRIKVYKASANGGIEEKTYDKIYKRSMQSCYTFKELAITTMNMIVSEIKGRNQFSGVVDINNSPVIPAGWGDEYDTATANISWSAGGVSGTYATVWDSLVASVFGRPEVLQAHRNDEDPGAADGSLMYFALLARTKEHHSLEDTMPLWTKDDIRGIISEIITETSNASISRVTMNAVVYGNSIVFAHNDPTLGEFYTYTDVKDTIETMIESYPSWFDGFDTDNIVHYVYRSGDAYLYSTTAASSAIDAYLRKNAANYRLITDPNDTSLMNEFVANAIHIYVEEANEARMTYTESEIMDAVSEALKDGTTFASKVIDDWCFHKFPHISTSVADTLRDPGRVEMTKLISDIHNWTWNGVKY